MTIGVLHMDFLITGAQSLKDKRRVVKSLKDQLQSRFNCAVAETVHQDLWQRTRISVCVLSNESRHANAQLTEIGRFAEQRANALMINHEIEMIG